MDYRHTVNVSSALDTKVSIYWKALSVRTDKYKFLFFMGLILREEVRMQEAAIRSWIHGSLQLSGLHYVGNSSRLLGSSSLASEHQSRGKPGLSDRPQDGEGMLPRYI